MIEKLEPLQGLDHSWLNKINELVDVVNEMASYVGRLGVEFIEPKTPSDIYAEQRKWVGKLCRFWDDDYKTIKHFGILASINEREFCKYEADNGNYFCACEPVKPDDDIIYKGE